VRNVHQSFEHGLLAGLAYSGLSLFTGGWWLKDPMPAQAGYQRIVKLADKPDDQAAYFAVVLVPGERKPL